MHWKMFPGVLIIRGLLGPRMSYGVLSVLAVKFVLLRMSSATVNWNFNQLTQRTLGNDEIESQPCLFKSPMIYA